MSFGAKICQSKKLLKSQQENSAMTSTALCRITEIANAAAASRTTMNGMRLGSSARLGTEKIPKDGKAPMEGSREKANTASGRR